MLVILPSDHMPKNGDLGSVGRAGGHEARAQQRGCACIDDPLRTIIKSNSHPSQGIAADGLCDHSHRIVGTLLSAWCNGRFVAERRSDERRNSVVIIPEHASRSLEDFREYL